MILLAFFLVYLERQCALNIPAPNYTMQLAHEVSLLQNWGLRWVHFSCSVTSDPLQPHGLQHTRPPCSSPTPGARSNSCPLIWLGHPTISSSVIPFSSCLQSFPASGSFLMSWLFASGGQSIRASASTSVLPMNVQDWFPLGWTSWISLQSKGLLRVFSNTVVQSINSLVLSFLCNPTLNIHTWLLEKP